MCEPTTLTMLSIASSAVGMIQQQQAASEQRRANQQAYNAQMQAYRYNQANANFEKIAESQNAAEQQLVNNMAARSAKATATVAAGESGVSGMSVDALLADIDAKAGRDNVNTEVNYLRRDQAINADLYNNYAKTASAINSIPPVKRPDYLGTALRIGEGVKKLRES